MRGGYMRVWYVIHNIIYDVLYYIVSIPFLALMCSVWRVSFCRNYKLVNMPTPVPRTPSTVSCEQGNTKQKPYTFAPPPPHTRNNIYTISRVTSHHKTNGTMVGFRNEYSRKILPDVHVVCIYLERANKSVRFRENYMEIITDGTKHKDKQFAMWFWCRLLKFGD